MQIVSQRAVRVFQHPWRFLVRTIASFRANRGLLLAGATAYYALLSIVPLLTLVVVVLSQLVDQTELMRTLARYLEWLMPGHSQTIIGELSQHLGDSSVVGGVLLLTMLFFSSLAFGVLNEAMAVIFAHRVRHSRRHFLVAALLPYVSVFVLGAVLLVVTSLATALQALSAETIALLGREWSLLRLSRLLLYLLGLGSEILLVAAIYLVMPVGRMAMKHALLGGLAVALMWEVVRHVLVWYFATLSQASLVYGSLTTAIVVMLSFEVAATLLLFGAQLISEYERVCAEPQFGAADSP